MALNFLRNSNVYNPNWKPTMGELYKINPNTSNQKTMTRIVKCTEDKGNGCYIMMLIDRNEDDINDDLGGWLVDIKFQPIYSLDESDINNIRHERLTKILNN